jgi:hypothetical protein
MWQTDGMVRRLTMLSKYLIGTLKGATNMPEYRQESEFYDDVKRVGLPQILLLGCLANHETASSHLLQGARQRSETRPTNDPHVPRHQRHILGNVHAHVLEAE